MQNTSPPSDSAPVDIQAFLNEHRFSACQWLVFALCFLIMVLDGFDTAAIGYIAPSLMVEWGVAKASLTPVLSAALFGLAAGALVAGPLADRLGRKTMLVGSVGVFGAACLASAFATSLSELTMLRFATGVGLGAAMPNVITLMSEYCPDRRRAVLTSAMFSGFPLGAAFGGLLAAWIIPQFGWRGVLTLGGVLPLVLTVLLVFLLPESVRYMVAKRHAVARIQAVLGRIAGRAVTTTRFTLTEARAATAAGKSGLALVLSRGYVLGSVLLWLTYFMGLVIFYALLNWMPLLLKDAGITPKTATLVSALFPLGGVGAAVFGWLMDRFNGTRLVALCYFLTTISIFAIGKAAGGEIGLLLVVIFVAGVLTCTAQASLPALAAAFYPTAGRATGVSWMLGIGRFGGIAGSFLVAELARGQLGIDAIFTVLALPALIAALALMLTRAVEPRERTSPRAAAAPEQLAVH